MATLSSCLLAIVTLNIVAPVHSISKYKDGDKARITYIYILDHNCCFDYHQIGPSLFFIAIRYFSQKLAAYRSAADCRFDSRMDKTLLFFMRSYCFIGLYFRMYFLLFIIQVEVYVNKVGPYFNVHETYHYYEIQAVCSPDTVGKNYTKYPRTIEYNIII